MLLTFSNPRRQAIIPDWPLGRDQRGPATFTVESDPRKGERIARVTTGKPKRTTYAHKACVVDGSNGRTYLLLYDRQFGESVRIASSDMQRDAPQAETGLDSAYVRPDDPDFATLKALVLSAS